MIVDPEARLRHWLSIYGSTADEFFRLGVSGVLDRLEEQRREIESLRNDALFLQRNLTKSSNKKGSRK